jgi:hypothetical protein
MWNVRIAAINRSYQLAKSYWQHSKSEFTRDEKRYADVGNAAGKELLMYIYMEEIGKAIKRNSRVNRTASI